MDYNSDELTKIHRLILEEKPMMKNVFISFHKTIKKYAKQYLHNDGIEVELGAGVYPIKNTFKEVISSDIKKTQYTELVVDAQNMPFENETVSVIYGVNCFHHFPEPEKFFNELDRVLVKNGGCILIEPYYGFLASSFYKNSFDSEHFNKSQSNWTNKESQIMTGANQALSYIVFKRDYEQFINKYPNLEIVKNIRCNNYLRYIVSGGLNFKQLLPNYCIPLIKLLEFLLIPINIFLALHHIIIIRKKR
ncbi:MAG: methyltransferase [Bacteroidetes bacterium GWE2_29_8]|nr:MAG: methyltransferase [Bacteroidetes bacterium GWE2_29_8]OFY17760.1 MAG: methyltransferase [Bacteroidetes bacterium GWF2_29_10]